MNHIWNTTHLKAVLGHKVDIVDQLPPHLEGDPDGHVMSPVKVDGSDPQSWEPYMRVLARQQVLYVDCPISTVTWTTPALWELWATTLAALRLNRKVERLATEQMKIANSRVLPAGLAFAHGTFLGLQTGGRPSERLALCTVEETSSCYVPAPDAATIVESALAASHITRSKPYQVLYVAAHNFTKDTALQILNRTSFTAVVSSSLLVCRRAAGSGSAGQVAALCTEPRIAPAAPEIQAAVEYSILSKGLLLWGNWYLPTSFILRLQRHRARDVLSEPNTGLYYNADPSSIAMDVAPYESTRYLLSGGLNTTLYDWSAAGHHTTRLLAAQRHGECSSALNWGPSCIALAAGAAGTGEEQAAAGPRASQVHATSASCSGNVVKVQGRLRNCTLPGMRLRVSVTVKGDNGTQLASDDVTSTQVTAAGAAVFLATLVLPVPWQVAVNQAYTVVACADGTDRPGNDTRMCKEVEAGSCTVRYGVQGNVAADDMAPVVYLTLSKHPSSRAGGRQSMHQLSDAINQAYAKGEIAVRSVVHHGSPFLAEQAGRYGNVSVSELKPTDVTARDYVLPAESSINLPSWYATLAPSSGALTLVYYLGQFSDRLEGTLDTRGYKPLCRTHFLGHLFSCPPKAQLIAPMSRHVYNASSVYEALRYKPRKQDIVLLDPDKSGILDLTKIKVPRGAELVQLFGYSNEQVLQLYQHAKVYVDTYMTGIERSILESNLFGVVPIVAYHGNGLDNVDFPIPFIWRWQPHNYTQLNQLIVRALADHQGSLRAFEKLHQRTLSLVDSFPREVIKYFQDDVHIMIPAYGAGGINSRLQGLAALVAFIANAVSYPFATQEVVASNGFYWAFDFALSIKRMHGLGTYESLTISRLLPHLKRYPPQLSAFLQPPLAGHIRRYALLLPPGTLPVHPGLVRALFKTARARSLDLVEGPHGIWLVRSSSYYAAVERVLPALAANGSASSGWALQQLLGLLQASGLQTDKLAKEQLGREEPGVEALASCSAAAVPLLLSAAGEAGAALPNTPRCLCGPLVGLLRSTLFVGQMQLLPEVDLAAAAAWRRAALQACGTVQVA